MTYEVVTLDVQVQIQNHTCTCRRGSMLCRFKYPRPLSSETKLFSGVRSDMRKCDFYLIRRGEGEGSVVPYNPPMLSLWGANMDSWLVVHMLPMCM